MIEHRLMKLFYFRNDLSPVCKDQKESDIKNFGNTSFTNSLPDLNISTMSWNDDKLLEQNSSLNSSFSNKSTLINDKSQEDITNATRNTQGDSWEFKVGGNSTNDLEDAIDQQNDSYQYSLRGQVKRTVSSMSTPINRIIEHQNPNTEKLSNLQDSKENNLDFNTSNESKICPEVGDSILELKMNTFDTSSTKRFTSLIPVMKDQDFLGFSESKDEALLRKFNSSNKKRKQNKEHTKPLKNKRLKTLFTENDKSCVPKKKPKIKCSTARKKGKQKKSLEVSSDTDSLPDLTKPCSNSHFKIVPNKFSVTPQSTPVNNKHKQKLSKSKRLKGLEPQKSSRKSSSSSSKSSLSKATQSVKKNRGKISSSRKKPSKKELKKSSHITSITITPPTEVKNRRLPSLIAQNSILNKRKRITKTPGNVINLYSVICIGLYCHLTNSHLGMHSNSVMLGDNSS